MIRVSQARGWARPCHRPSPKYWVPSGHRAVKSHRTIQSWPGYKPADPRVFAATAEPLRRCREPGDVMGEKLVTECTFPRLHPGPRAEAAPPLPSYCPYTPPPRLWPGNSGDCLVTVSTLYLDRWVLLLYTGVVLGDSQRSHSLGKEILSVAERPLKVKLQSTTFRSLANEMKWSPPQSCQPQSLHVTALRGEEIITQTLCKTLAVLFNIDFTTLRTGHRVRSASLAQHLAPAPASTVSVYFDTSMKMGGCCCC